DNKEKTKSKISLNFSTIGLVTVSLPSLSLIICFITAILFRYDQITETECNNTNNIPSVSAITGVSPPRYVWRVGIALHSAPRFVIGLMYLNFYNEKLSMVPKKLQGLFKILYRCVFVFYTIENSCLVLVSYISNVENYAIHEKIFIVFMFAAVIHQICTMVIYPWCFSDMKSFEHKWFYFLMLCVSTATLLFCFILHRLYCIPGAFSVFSTAEYFIVLSVTGFHYTAVLDFKNSHWSI
ncbi:hypothetical protein HELRODRAFT_123698, partial [Helobdella robusta]|uniref:CWH43-like N-terminal domain-containing protein n=1 Tax=Helobdella robusta TaxID=6412 RepID=T1EGY5_HELRO